MIIFDENKVKFKKVKLKTISTNTIQFEENNKLIKMECPTNISQMFKSIYGITSFATPYECCLALYENNLIAVEKAPITDRYFESVDMDGNIVKKEWLPRMEKYFDKCFNLLGRDEWYFDGS